MLIRAFYLSFALLFLTSSIAPGVTVSHPASLEELSGTWLGGSEANSEYFRLEIDGSGKGILTVQYVPEERAAAYDIVSTQLSEYEIRFELFPRDAAEPIFLRGTANASGMELVAGSIAQTWQRNVALERESAVRSRIEAVTRRAREIGHPAK